MIWKPCILKSLFLYGPLALCLQLSSSTHNPLLSDTMVFVCLSGCLLERLSVLEECPCSLCLTSAEVRRKSPSIWENEWPQEEGLWVSASEWFPPGKEQRFLPPFSCLEGLQQIPTDILPFTESQLILMKSTAFIFQKSSPHFAAPRRMVWGI